jgi:HEAT repeat protein
LIGYVFMSYSRKDEEIMRFIARFLRAQGMKVWVDNEKLIPGTPIWEDAIEKAIRDSAAIVVVLSPDSKSSEWVRREISLADQHRKRVFPVLASGDENSSITLRLINRQFVDIRQNKEKGLKSLSEALSFYINELILHEQRALEEKEKISSTSAKTEAAHLPGQKMSSTKISAAPPSKKTPEKSDERSPEPLARGNIFGWLTGAKGEAKRLIAQLADPATRDQAARELIGLGADAVPPLVDALQSKDQSLLPIYEQILARIPSASPELIKTLATAHPILRARAADVFSLSKDKAAIPALLKALQGEYFTVRARAALALGKIGDPKAIQPLLAALKDPEVDVRIAACLALGLFKDPTTFDEITNILLDDAKIEVRQAAAKALGHTKHPAALPYLMEALRDPFWWFEREVQAGDLFAAIEKMGTAAVEPLLEALQDKEGTVRRYSAGLLGRIGDPRAIESLGMALYDLHHDVGQAAAEALANFGATSFDVLVEAVSHPEMWIRIHSIQALARIKDPRVAGILVQMLNDPEREVKRHVIEAMAELKDTSVLSALQSIMVNRSDRELHTLAKDAIAKIS